MNQDCVVCKEVPVDVVQSHCCASLYCWECVVRTPSCVVCETEIDLGNCEIPVVIRDEIEKKVYACSFQEYGCFALLQCREKKIHQGFCQYKPVPCPFKPELCGLVAFQNFKDHESKCCYRPIQCPFSCPQQFMAAELQLHAQVCLELIMECPNQCNTQLRRKVVNKHIQEECIFTLKACPFAGLGCEQGEALVRGAYEEHMKERTQQHLDLALNKIMKQESQIEGLKKRERWCEVLQNLPVNALVDCVFNRFSEARNVAVERVQKLSETAHHVTESANKIVSVVRSRIEGLSNGQWMMLCLCLFVFWRLPCFLKGLMIGVAEFKLYKRHVSPTIRGAAFGWQLFMTMFYIYLCVTFIRILC